MVIHEKPPSKRPRIQSRLVFRVFSIKAYLTEVSEQPRGGTPVLNVKAIRDWRHANVSKQRTLLADVDVACAPSEDSDQSGHPPSLIRVIAVRMKKAWVLSYPLSAKRRLWSDWADAQADLSLRWAHSHHLIPSPSRNLGGHRGTTDDVATIPFHPSLSSAALREFPNPRSRPFLDVIFPSLLLSSSPSCSFHCPLQNCLRHAKRSWDVAIPSEFPFLYHG